ncbi:MAG: site-2 protease family protein [Candidatus Saccharimonadales bacterium]
MIDIVLYLGVVLGVILISMTFHEVMHGYVAYWLGDDTAKAQGRLTFNPIHHIDPFLTIILPIVLVLLGGPIFGGAKPVPFNPARLKYDELGAALVAVAGPLTNLVLAFVAFGIWTLLGNPSPSGDIIGLLFYTATTVNLGFFVFNIIPIPPLDGSRVLYALAPDFVRRAMEAIEQFGIIFVFVIVMLASSAIGYFMQNAINFLLGILATIYGIG